MGTLLLAPPYRGVVPGGARGAITPPPQILEDKLTLSQQGGADYAHHINTGTPKFLNLPTALQRARPEEDA